MPDRPNSESPDFRLLNLDISPTQVALCLIDLKLARLNRDPAQLDSIVDVAGYAACLREVTRG